MYLVSLEDNSENTQGENCSCRRRDEHRSSASRPRRRGRRPRQPVLHFSAVGATFGRLRVSKKSLFSLDESGDFGINRGKKREKETQKGVLPTPYCQLFQVHGSIFKPHPACDPGQTSMMRATQRMFFFCVGKDTFNRLFAHGVDLFPSIRFAELLHKVKIFLPDIL